MAASELGPGEEKRIPNVTAVIINWNGKIDLLECLDSLCRLDYPPEFLEIVVVDNGSTDGSRKAVTESYENVLLLENKDNLGYVRAVNRGVQHALEKGADYVWVLNNDVAAEVNSLSRLVEAGERNPQAGVIGPVVCSSDDPGKIDNSGYRIDYWTGRMIRLGFGRDVFRDRDVETERVESNLGCANLIKAKVFTEVGLFDPVYEIYFEETDFNVRAGKQGFQVILARDARVTHKHASTMNKYLFRRAGLLLRNLMIFQFRHAPSWKLVVFLPYYFLVHLPYFLLYGSFYGVRERVKRIRRWGEK